MNSETFKYSENPYITPYTALQPAISTSSPTPSSEVPSLAFTFSHSPRPVSPFTPPPEASPIPKLPREPPPPYPPTHDIVRTHGFRNVTWNTWFSLTQRHGHPLCPTLLSDTFISEADLLELALDRWDEIVAANPGVGAGARENPEGVKLERKDDWELVRDEKERRGIGELELGKIFERYWTGYWMLSTASDPERAFNVTRRRR